MDAAIVQILAKLKLLKVFDFFKTRSLTPEQQGWLQLICDRYVHSPEQEGDDIKSLVVPEISFLFFMFGKAMAIESVRDRDETKIFRGFVALSVENQKFDWRDSLVVLSLLYNSATIIGADSSKMLLRVAEISTPRTRDSFLDFMTRDPGNRDISKFGYKEGTDSEGSFSYVPS